MITSHKQNNQQQESIKSSKFMRYLGSKKKKIKKIHLTLPIKDNICFKQALWSLFNIMESVPLNKSIKLDKSTSITHLSISLTKDKYIKTLQIFVNSFLSKWESDQPAIINSKKKYLKIVGCWKPSLSNPNSIITKYPLVFSYKKENIKPFFWQFYRIYF